MFISNRKKHKYQGMSKHLKDPKNTTDPRGLNKEAAGKAVMLPVV